MEKCFYQNLHVSVKGLEEVSLVTLRWNMQRVHASELRICQVSGIADL